LALREGPLLITEVDPGTVFSRLKALVGEWDVESSSGKAHSRFELIARGSVLLLVKNGKPEIILKVRVADNTLGSGLGSLPVNLDLRFAYGTFWSRQFRRTFSLWSVGLVCIGD
jgi:hypothetical protein